MRPKLLPDADEPEAEPTKALMNARFKYGHGIRRVVSRCLATLRTGYGSTNAVEECASVPRDGVLLGRAGGCVVRVWTVKIPTGGFMRSRDRIACAAER